MSGATVQVTGQPSPGIEFRGTAPGGGAVRVQVQLQKRLFERASSPLHALSNLVSVTGIPGAGSAL